MYAFQGLDLDAVLLTQAATNLCYYETRRFMTIEFKSTDPSLPGVMAKHMFLGTQTVKADGMAMVVCPQDRKSIDGGYKVEYLVKAATPL